MPLPDAPPGHPQPVAWGAKPVAILIPRGPADGDRWLNRAAVHTLATTGSQILYVDNGQTHPDAAPVANHGGETILTVAEAGLPGALIVGYQHLTRTGAPGIPIIRMDCDEHPIELAPALLDELADVDVVVAVPALNRDTMTDPFDLHLHQRVIPNIFANVSSTLAPLGGAHGYQAWSPPVVRATLPFACMVMDAAAARQGRAPQWGFDAAMIVCATLLGFCVRITHYPPTRTRARPPGKAAAQVRSLKAVVDAALAIKNPQTGRTQDSAEKEER